MRKPRVTNTTPARLTDQAATAHRQTPEGMGLGLSIVQAIVQAHGGTVEVQPNPGGGSVFTVRLPRRLRAPAATAQGGVVTAAQGLA